MGATFPPSSPAGSSGQVQYNNAGAAGGASQVSINTDGTLNATPEVIAFTGTAKTLALTDANTIQDCSNVSTQTITIPANASVAFPVNTTVYCEKNGAGNLVIQAATGVTLNGVSEGSYTISSAAQTGMVYLRKESTNVWYLQSAASGTGTVTSLGLSTNASYLTVGSSPVTNSGTITVNKATGLTANRFVATPDGTTGAADLRAIVAGDLPLATASAFGAVKPDGTTITISGGVISAPGGGGGSGTLGSSTSATSPQISGDATTGLYTAGAGKVDVSISGSKVVEWSSTGEAVTGVITATGQISTSAAGAASTPAFLASGTPFLGTGTTSVPLAYLLDGAATAPTNWSTSGTYFGINANTSFAGNFVSFYKNGGSSVFSIAANGGLTSAGTGTFNSVVSTGSVSAGSAVKLQWTSRSAMFSPSDGVIELTNAANNDFGRLQFGGTTSSFPALKRTTTALNVRLADDSGDGDFTAGALALSGKINTYNNIATAGNGVASIQGMGRVTAQTAAAASVCTYTVGAADASFLVSANVLVTASTTHSFTVTVSYTDEGNTARTLTLNFSTVGGTIGTSIANAGGAVPYEGLPVHIRAKASTAITIATTGTFTSVTYNAEGMITKVA